MKTEYLLYDGTSEDGRGAGRYIGRTEDKGKAIRHFMKTKKNPYSTGFVEILTDTIKIQVLMVTDFDYPVAILAKRK